MCIIHILWYSVVFLVLSLFSVLWNSFFSKIMKRVLAVAYFLCVLNTSNCETWNVICRCSFSLSVDDSIKFFSLLYLFTFVTLWENVCTINIWTIWSNFIESFALILIFLLIGVGLAVPRGYRVCASIF